MNSSFDEHTQRAIARTSMGVVALADIAYGFEYVPSSAARRSKAAREQFTQLFASIHRERALGKDIAGSFSKGKEHMLVFSSKCDKALAHRDGKDTTEWRFLPWPNCGLALVVVTDPHYATDQWLAFVSMEDLANTLRAAQKDLETQLTPVSADAEDRTIATATP